MKYLCLGYHDEATWSALSESERKAVLDESFAYENELRKNGHVLGAEALERPEAAATLRFNGGKFAITDGPFAETKEQLGGIMVLEAKDLNHAIQLMAQLPCMRLGGSLEIRPINVEIAHQIAARGFAAISEESAASAASPVRQLPAAR